MASKASRVTLSNARQAAQVHKWVEMYINEATCVVSFVRGDARINVYYAGGTVVTLLDNGDRGRSQLIRIKCSISVLIDMFKNPRLHTTINYCENLDKEKVFERRLGDDVKDVIDDELVAIQAYIKSLDEEYIQVRMHRDGLVSHARNLMAERKRTLNGTTGRKVKAESTNVLETEKATPNEHVEKSEVVAMKQLRARTERKKLEEEDRRKQEIERKRIEEARKQELYRKKAEDEKRRKEEMERAKAAEEKRRKEEIERARAAEEKRRQAEIERKNAEEAKKRRQLELELEKITEKRKRAHEEEAKQNQESKLRRRKLEELIREEENDLQKAIELQRIHNAEREKEEMIRKKLANMQNSERRKVDSNNSRELESSGSGSKQRMMITDNEHIGIMRGRDGTRFATNAKFDAEVIKFFEDMDSNKEHCEIDILEITPSNGIYCTKVGGSSFRIGGGTIHPLLEPNRNSRTCSKKPVLVALGSHSRSSIQYDNGQWITRGPGVTAKEFGSRRVAVISYGQYKDSFFLKLDDGLMFWANVPSRLQKLLLMSRASLLPPVENLSLGPKGQFFVRFTNKDCRAGGLSVADKNFLTQVPGNVVAVRFASVGLVARYTPFATSDSSTSESESQHSTCSYLEEKPTSSNSQRVNRVSNKKRKRENDSLAGNEAPSKRLKLNRDAEKKHVRGSAWAHNFKNPSYLGSVNTFNYEQLAQTDFICLSHGWGPIRVMTDGSFRFERNEPPSALRRILCSLKTPSRVQAFAFDSQTRFFIQWVDGNNDGSKELKNRLRGKYVEFVAFGPKNREFFQVRGLGMMYKNLPQSLTEIILNVQNSVLPAIEYLSFGSGDDFFVRLADGTCRYSFKSKRGVDFIQDLPGIPRELVFRRDSEKSHIGHSSFAVRFNPEEEKY